MKYDPFEHHRRSIRLQGYNYSQAGAYFVTICVNNRECLFGEIIDDTMRLNEYGQIIQVQWDALPERFPNVELDEFIVMPNHVHGIIVLGNDRDVVGAIHELPLRELPLQELPLRIQRRKMLLPKIIGYFKMNTAKRINILRDSQGVPVWQRNYYEYIVRNDADLNRIRTYIVNNPFNWHSDDENPARKS